MQKITISLQRSNIIRGLAILAVMLLHVLPYLKGIYHGNYQFFFVFIDQLARFCVPAFLMLSGYGLAYKYDGKKIKYVEFLRERLGKLLPLYLIWSFVSILIVSSIPQWSFGNQPASIPIQLLLGQADYQLYFLPVLFQLYGLFPLLWLLKKKPRLLLFLAVAIQLSLYLYYASAISNSDRFEYVLSLSWIGYFVLGIYLKIGKVRENLLRVSPFLAMIALLLATFWEVGQINAGVDPLPVLKFTKLILVPYVMASILSLVFLKFNFMGGRVRAILAKLTLFLSWLGKNSFLIFLSHTILFRIIYAIIYQQLEPFVLIRTIIFWLLTVILSHWLISSKLLAKK